MTLEALDGSGSVLAAATAYSTGGGKVVWERDDRDRQPETVYELATMSGILARLADSGQTFWEYAEEREGPELWPYLSQVWKAMKEAVERGIEAEGVLPGGLRLPRKASSYFVRANGFRVSLKRRSMLFAYALAVAEENAAGGRIVTAPTCGSCGVVPAVLYGMSANHGFSDGKILKALATAGVVGGPGQGQRLDLGRGGRLPGRDRHRLFDGRRRRGPAVRRDARPDRVRRRDGPGAPPGPTCDPVGGLVQIPCIERNAFAASRALDANTYALLSDGRHRISFDTIVETMNRTGNDLPRIYKETSEGGLALAKRG